MIADFEVLDVEGMREYTGRVDATIEQYGGTYLVQGGRGEIIEEGDWHPRRLVILKFESIEQAKRRYYSEEYAAIKEGDRAKSA